MNTATENSTTTEEYVPRHTYVIAILLGDEHIVSSVWNAKEEIQEEIHGFLTDEIKDEDDEHDPWKVFEVIPNNNQTEKLDRIKNSVEVEIPEHLNNRGLDNMNHLMSHAFNVGADKIFLLKEWKNYAPNGWYVCNLNTVQFESLEDDPFIMNLISLR